MNDMHVFEINHEGNAVAIWEEIENNTKKLHASAESEHHKADISGQRSEKLVDEQEKHLRPSASRYDEDSRTTLETIPAKSYFRSKVETAGLDDKQITAPAYEGMRELHFEATNPPRISHPGSFANASSMSAVRGVKISDVLNSADPQLPVSETYPEMEPFQAGYLTAEGKRQVRSRCS